MHRYRILILAFAVGSHAFTGHAQDSVDSPSSDDISVADGLQLPVYGRIWALDTWKGIQELVQLGRVEIKGKQVALTLKSRHPLEIPGEAANVRIHPAALKLFLRRPAGQPSSGSSPFAIVRLTVTGQNRQITKAASDDLAREAKGDKPRSEDLIELEQERIGATNWYRLFPEHPLSPDEYAIIPLPGSQSASPDEIYDFAVDPQAPENLKPLRSERDRP
jgi:hypothetical protein